MGTLSPSFTQSVFCTSFFTFFLNFVFLFIPFLHFTETMASNEDLKKAFLNFANQGKSGATVQELDNKNWTKMAKHINFDVFLKFIDELATKFYKGDAQAVAKYRQLIVTKGAPVNQGTKVATGNNVGKMTDTSQYTGAHKERFDESGKGKGIEGREDVTQNDGYVTGYNNKGTYDKK